MMFQYFLTTARRCATIELDQNELRYQVEGVQKSHLALDKLEMLRVSTTAGESLNLISDHQVVVIPVKEPTAQWLRHNDGAGVRYGTCAFG